MPRSPFTVPLPLAALALIALVRAAGAFTADEAKMPMTVTLVRSDAPGCGADCPEWLALTGKIGPDTPARFSAALGRLGRRNVPVLVDSPGGSVEAAMAIGRAVRARRMSVAVAGTALTDCAAADGTCAARRRAGERPGFVAGGTAACASACVLILAAGTGRSVGEHSYVGVHQMTAHKTLVRVMNYFRIMRRMVNGRPVEVSRTLIGTKPISSTTTTVAASETMYSEVDRYLLGLGIGESIMPLMRSAPPSGIHWMTQAELGATRIATDTTDAPTLVARAAEMASPAVGKASAMALAAAKLGDGAQASGIVDWRVAVADGNPTLVGTVDVPERRLHGTVALRRDTAPGGSGGFVATVDFGPPAAIDSGRQWTSEAPAVCDGTECLPFFTPAVELDDGRGKRQFRVRAAWGDTFLLRLEDRRRVSIPLSSDGAVKGWVTASLTDGARTAVVEWEHLCCGRPLDDPPQPAFEPASSPTLDGNATASWTVLREGALPPQPGATFLMGGIEVPAVGLRLSLEAGLVPRGSGDGVAVTLHLVPDVARFGPVTALTVETIKADGRIAVIGSVRPRPLGGYDLTLVAAAHFPRDAALALTMADAHARRLHVTVPMPGALWELLADARLRPS